MNSVSQTYELALQCHEAGKLQQAELLCRQVLQMDTAHADALHLLGLIAAQIGRTDLSVDYMHQALRLNPNNSKAYNNLGIVLKDQGKLEEAIANFQHALRLKPDFAEAYNNLGNILNKQGKLEEAIASFRHAVKLSPDLAVAHNNLGNALKDQGELHEAISCFHRALRMRPDYAEALNNLGNTYKDQGELDEAISCFHRALRQRPDYAEAHNNLGNAFYDRGRLEEAEACYRMAMQLRPDLAEAHINLGNVLKKQGNLPEAAASYRYALRLRPDLAVAHNNLGNALKDNGELDEAIACYREALRIRPDYAAAHSNLVYSLLYNPCYEETAILREARRWHQNHAEPLAPFHRAHANDPNPDRRLRVGYVSSDFREHPAAFLLLPLFLNHDRNQVEVYCYAGVTCPDRFTNRFRAHSDVWRSTVGLTDNRLAELVRSDRIDVLVDLTLHMVGSRLLAFARRPAPVQVTWFGYPGTTGLSAIDYRLSDPHLDPPGETDDCYSEQTVHLPDTFWCYDPLTDDEQEASELPAQTGESFTFGCLNNFSKVNAGVLDLWAAVLREVPGSRLLLLAPAGHARDRVRAHLEREGLSGLRVGFVDRQSRQKYLHCYSRVDVALDPLPYNGHTTSLDAAWMGVPTITQIGTTVVGRAGWSILNNLGLRELAAKTPAEYVAIAAQLAGNLTRLRELRATLRARLRASPLMDGKRFARHMEDAYWKMWCKWCQKGEKPK